VALVIAIFVARHNLKLGRADTKGGLRLLIFVFCAVALAQLVGSDHVPELGAELFIFFQIASLALFMAGLVWLFYIAVEPFIRKRWPELIISWSRLLAGDLRDPMVGRDVLIGGFFGLLHTVVIYLMVLLPNAMDIPVAPNVGGDPETLMGVSGLAVYTLNGLAMPAFLTVAPAFLLLVFLAIFRRKWLAVGALWLLVFVAEGLAFASNGPAIGWIVPALVALSLVISLTRFGLLALYSYYFFWVMTFHLILTADLSSWYARNTIFSFVVVMILAVYGFYVATAGQPLLKGDIVEADS
jgi:serine/threonine-protein kinase